MFKFRQKTHFISAARSVSGQIDRIKAGIRFNAKGNKSGQAEAILPCGKTPDGLLTRFQ